MPDARGPLSETAYAKINLALHVRERLPDGYHRIETLFAFCEDGDRLTVEEADRVSLTIDGPFADGLSSGDDNLVMRAAMRLSEALAPGRGAAMRLTKRLPVASGMGGGSADAAAALRLLARLWDVSPDEEAISEIAEGLGADVPACLLSQTCRGAGRGDDLAPVGAPDLKGQPVLLVNPRVPVSTGPVFAAWDGQDRGGFDLSGSAAFDSDWRNDLYEPAVSLAPEIAEVIEALETQPGAEFVRMSGSGATCFALFGDSAARTAAASAAGNAHPGWWVFETALR